MNIIGRLAKSLNIWRPPASNLLRIDRSRPLDRKIFELPADFRVAREDPVSISLREIDISGILFEEVAQVGPDSGKILITNGRRILRGFDGKGLINLDAGILQSLYENENKIPITWKRMRQPIFFQGTIIATPEHDICVLGIDWSKELNRWQVGYYYHEIYEFGPFAVLPIDLSTPRLAA